MYFDIKIYKQLIRIKNILISRVVLKLKTIFLFKKYFNNIITNKLLFNVDGSN